RFFYSTSINLTHTASRRALQILSEGGILTNEEVPQARKVLTAAALTYVAAAVSVLLQLLRLFLLFGGGRRR
ncbi:zinc metallopeptidase, partial [Tetragenococcus halophilus]|uniref:zinc metallopeptidase n=1 Tax=Tetragenococcus halophilus TaxID=51669 RepID=UPI0020954ADB